MVLPLILRVMFVTRNTERVRQKLKLSVLLRHNLWLCNCLPVHFHPFSRRCLQRIHLALGAGVEKRNRHLHGLHQGGRPGNEAFQVPGVQQGLLSRPKKRFQPARLRAPEAEKRLRSN